MFTFLIKMHTTIKVLYIVILLHSKSNKKIVNTGMTLYSLIST